MTDRDIDASLVAAVLGEEHGFSREEVEEIRADLDSPDGEGREGDPAAILARVWDASRDAGELDDEQRAAILSKSYRFIRGLQRAHQERAANMQDLVEEARRLLEGHELESATAARQLERAGAGLVQEIEHGLPWALRREGTATYEIRWPEALGRWEGTEGAQDLRVAAQSCVETLGEFPTPVVEQLAELLLRGVRTGALSSARLRVGEDSEERTRLEWARRGVPRTEEELPPGTEEALATAEAELEPADEEARLAHEVVDELLPEVTFQQQAAETRRAHEDVRDEERKLQEVIDAVTAAKRGELSPTRLKAVGSRVFGLIRSAVRRKSLGPQKTRGP